MPGGGGGYTQYVNIYRLRGKDPFFQPLWYDKKNLGVGYCTFHWIVPNLYNVSLRANRRHHVFRSGALIGLRSAHHVPVGA